MAARKFGVPIDLTKNELQNAAMHNLAAAPGTPTLGQYYYDTVTNKFMLKNNVAFIDMLARANHSGTQLASTISDFDVQVRLSRLDQMAAPTADVALNTRKITGLGDGTLAQDAATYGQLLAVQNGRDFKDSVRAATAAAGTLATSFANASIIDGVTLATGNRILLKDQAAGAENGIYVVQATGAPVRATDADTSAKVTANMTVLVEEGTVNADKQITLTTNNPVTLGTTALVFAVSGTGTTYTSGTGINIVGSVINIDITTVSRKFSSTFGDGTSTTFAVAHGLASLDVQVQVYDISTGATAECDMVRSSATNVNLIFVVAPTASQYRVVVQG